MTTTMQMATLSELGQAATTVAYSTQVGTQTYVLKRLKAEEHGNRRLRRLFPILASSASQFHHKHLARIFQVDGDSVQVLMQFFPATLQSRKTNSTLELLNVLAQSLKGLRYLHEQNVLHMNLKPSNLMFEESGNLRLADPLCFSPGSTVSFGINPDYRFFSPAQLDPIVQVSPACDVYGLAMTLAIALNEQAFESHISNCWNEPEPPQSGNVPAPHFVKSNSRSKTGAVARWSKWHNDYRHPNPSFRALDSSLPDALVGVLDRMLEKVADRRFSAAEDVLNALAGVAEASALSLSSKPKQTRASEARNWATGIETVVLGGDSAGESQFSTTAFDVAEEEGSKQVKGARLEPDGASWFLDVNDASQRFLVNGELKAGRIAVGHGDILRLGSAGPDILIHRNETDPERIISAAREAMQRDVERAIESDFAREQESKSASNARRTSSGNVRSERSSFWPLILITVIAAIVACVFMYLFVIGGSK